ncbi:MAG: phosphotransferase [Ardenticatenaceae bacterium]
MQSHKNAAKKLSARTTLISEAELAWPSGDRPGDLKFNHELPSSVSNAINLALHSTYLLNQVGGGQLHALCPPKGVIGRYKLSTREGKWFIRVSSRWGQPEIEKAITDYLIKQGVKINPLLVSGEKVYWNGQVFRLDVRPMIEGRHFNGSTEDIAEVAATLRACHSALLNFPEADRVTQTTSARYRHLAKIRDLIAETLEGQKNDLFVERATWADSHRDWLSDMVAHFDPSFDQYLGAQCIHGEIHPANVLYSREGSAILIDFEESVHVFAPPVWDFAFLVQRFCLHDNPAASVVRQRLSVITEAYGRPLPNLAMMMRQIAWFSMAIIVDLRISQSVVTPLSEYDKFVRLERQARIFENFL